MSGGPLGVCLALISASQIGQRCETAPADLVHEAPDNFPSWWIIETPSAPSNDHDNSSCQRLITLGDVMVPELWNQIKVVNVIAPMVYKGGSLRRMER
jgi:hypothetical protein